MIPSSGRSGGLVVAWDSSRISVTVLEENTQFFHLQCQSAVIPLFFLTAIYVIPHSNNREVLWNQLWRLSQGIKDPWCVMGDFNDISSTEERVGGRNGNPRRIRWFCERISECGLVDLGGIGPKMTWRGPQMAGCARLFERLDRALVNCRMLHSMPDSFLKGDNQEAISNTSSCIWS
ncbi:hypothetical protein K1719_038116 [Acacia pycnantha]|nr:hypothetical protein K1719_038116 [Acacia pycnantha]